MKTREEEINQQAEAFSAAHPEVVRLFVRFTKETIERGFAHYSCKAIFERIRWETDQADTDGRSTFKLNNNYTAWYARKFMERYPEHAGFFRTRDRISGKVKATDLPELTPEYFEGVEI